MGGLKVERFKEEVEGVVWKKSEELKVEQLLQNVLKTHYTLCEVWDWRVCIYYCYNNFFLITKAGLGVFYFILFFLGISISLWLLKKLFIFTSLSSLLYLYLCLCGRWCFAFTAGPCWEIENEKQTKTSTAKALLWIMPILF